MLLKRLLYENRTKYFHNFHGPKALSLCEFLKEKKRKKREIYVTNDYKLLFVLGGKP